MVTLVVDPGRYKFTDFVKVGLPLLFLTYLVAAIQTIFPDAVNDTQALLKAAALPPVPAIAGTLINELDQIDPLADHGQAPLLARAPDIARFAPGRRLF